MELSVPGEFGRYRLEVKLGKGAFGTVYKAWDTHLEVYVALKIPQVEGIDAERRKHILARFHREAKAAARLPPHTHICTVRDHGEIDGQPFVSMAFLEGRPLSQVRKPQPIRTTIRMLRRIARAMQVAHDNGVIHRDLKPDNIMVVEGDQPVVMDFGLARRLDSEESLQTVDGTVIGTPAYMSPEQAGGKQADIGPQADVYSLGVICYELLTGRRPFNAENVLALLAKIVTETPSPPSEFNSKIDPKLDAICLKMIARDLRDRFTTMKELDEALAGYYDQSRRERRASQPLHQAVATQPQATADMTPEQILPGLQEGDPRTTGDFLDANPRFSEGGNIDETTIESIQFATRIEEKPKSQTGANPAKDIETTLQSGFRRPLGANPKLLGAVVAAVAVAGIVVAKIIPPHETGPSNETKRSSRQMSAEPPAERDLIKQVPSSDARISSNDKPIDLMATLDLNARPQPGIWQKEGDALFGRQPRKSDKIFGLSLPAPAPLPDTYCLRMRVEQFTNEECSCWCCWPKESLGFWSAWMPSSPKGRRGFTRVCLWKHQKKRAKFFAPGCPSIWRFGC